MKKMILLLSALFALLYTYGQAISPDPTFAGQGWTYTDFKKGNYYNEYGQQVLLQKDGSFIVVIQLQGQYLVLARYLSNGSLDNRFGTDGYSEPIYVSSFQGQQAKADQQSDGRIIVGRVIRYEENRDIILSRYNANGFLDKSFGSDGSVRTDLGGSDNIISLAVQSDDRIVVAGDTYNTNTDRSDLVLVRYTKDGALDAGFDGDGKLTTAKEDYEWNDFMALQHDGKIVVCRIVQNIGSGIPPNIILNRYNQDGTLDAGFDEDGTLNTTFFNGEVTALAVQNDGKILLVGLANVNGVYGDFALRRYNADGSVDNSFGDEGKQITDFGGDEYAVSVAEQADGKIVVAGITNLYNTDNYDVALARYNEDGTLDGSFDSDGKLTTDFENPAGAYSVAVQSDGNIIVAGVAVQWDTFTMDYILARYSADGSLDSGFDGDGKLIGYYPAGFSETTSLAVQSDGKIIVAGGSGNSYMYNLSSETLFNRPSARLVPGQEESDVGLARYNADGTLDSSFGTNGKLVIDLGGIDEATSLVVQADGKVLIAGVSMGTETYIPQLFLTRINADGTFDNSFDGDGKLVTGFYSFGEEHSLALQRDGKIVVTGNVIDPEAEIAEFAVVRYNADGSLDHTFNGNGRSVAAFGSIAAASSLAIQGDGKIVAAGIVQYPNTYNTDVALARYNTDGSLDQSFDGDGMLITDFGSTYDFANAIAIQTDEKIVIAGEMTDYNSGNRIVVLGRYNTDGSLDSSFDGNGKRSYDLFESEVNTQSVLAPAPINRPFSPSLALQANGKLVVGGTTAYPAVYRDRDFALVRFNRDGSLDSSFGSKGKLTQDFQQGDDNATTLHIAGGKLYVGGYSTTVTQRGVLAAYHLDCADQERCGNRVDDNCDGQIDEGCPNTPFLTINDVTVSEDLQRATLMVTLSKKAVEPVQVSYFTVDRTAVSKANKGQPDFEAKSGTVTIPAGQQSAVLSINVFLDNLAEGEEFFDVHLQHPVHAALAGDKGRVTIKDPVAGGFVPLLTSPAAGDEQPVTPMLTLKAQPNPSATSFTLLVQSESNTPVVLKVTDATGRLVEVKTGLPPRTTLQLGQSWRPGVYYLDAVQGSERASLKLVKQVN